MRKGIIYVCINLFDGKRYIGKTLQSFTKRQANHIYDAMESDSQLFFHRALRKFGADNFVWSILESHVPESIIDEREQFYIKKYKTNNPHNGYNMTAGGNSSYNSVLSREDVAQIKHLLKTTDTLMGDIAKLYGIDRCSISDINCGETHYSVDEEYPLRVTKWSRDLTKKQVFEIYDLLRLGKSYTTIAKMYGVSVTNISNISLGKIHRYLDDTDYPLNKKAYVQLDRRTIASIVDMLKNTSLNDKEIADSLGISRKRVNNINLGTHNLDKLRELGIEVFPIRIPKSKTDDYKNTISNIIIDIVSTKDSLVSIAKKHNVSCHTVGNINRGISHVKEVNKLGYNSFPLRHK